MFTPFDRKSPHLGKFLFLKNRKLLSLILVLAALSSVLIAACTNDTSKKATTRPTASAQQYLVWDTTPASQIVEGEVTPFLAKALLSKQTGKSPSCDPSYSLAKNGTADATISIKGKTLEGIKAGTVTLTASCPADPQNSYPASSIDAKIEIAAKPRGNFQFGIYMDPIQAAWKKSALEATSSPFAIDNPSYSMYSYLTSVMTANNATQTIKDATFLILNESPGAYTINYRLNKEAGAYLLLVSYKKTPTDSEDFFAVRVKEQPEINDPKRTYSIKNADDLLKMRWNLSGTYNITKSFAMPALEAANYLAIPEYNTDGWLPVATEAKPFSGKLEGNGNTIMSLRSLSRGIDGASLLGYLKSATIQNLKLKNFEVIGAANYFGMLAGKAENVTLENIEGSVGTSKIITGLSYVGGLIGSVTNSDPSKTLKNLSVVGTVRGVSTAQGQLIVGAGGIFGSLTGNLESASYEGELWGVTKAGGIVGALSGKLQGATVLSKTQILGGTQVGGIVGALESGEIKRAASFAKLVGLYGAKYATSGTSTAFGGIVGYAKGSVSETYASSQIDNVYSDVGGLVGIYEGTSSSSIADSYASLTLLDASTTKVGGLVGSVGKAGSLILKNSFITAGAKDQATAIVADATTPNLQAAYFPGSVKGTGALAGSGAMVANSPSYDANFASYKTNGFWQFGDKANWPILVNLPVELTPIPIQ